MSWIDWSIMFVVLSFVTYAAVTSRKYNKSVADFLAANRCAGRYLLGVAQGEAAMAAVGVIALFELYYRAGFAAPFWTSVGIPIFVFATLSGWVIYRFRQTRAMTLAQFFEMRYSRRFRVFAGMLGWVSGVINFGIFPVVGARFFIYYCRIPSYVTTVGPLELNLTLGIVMLVLIGVALFFTFIGGQIAVLVTDFCQGFFSTCVFMILVVFLWYVLPWSKVGEALTIASSPGQSLFNPLDIKGQEDFNIWYFAIGWFFILYYRMAWQGAQGYNCAAITPHEAKMAQIVSNLRLVLLSLGLILIPLAALTYMNHPDYAQGATEVTGELHQAFPGDSVEHEMLRGQIRVPIVLRRLAPVGLIGVFGAAMLGFFISTHSTYLHSWGSMFIQDVVYPLRKRALAPKQHIRYLRVSIAGVAVFIFFFGLLFPMKEYIFMYWQITGAIYLGGAGSVIIGGLYWKRGTTAAAWVAMIVGSTFAVVSIILRNIWDWEHVSFLVEWWGQKLPYTSMEMAFFAAASAIVCYVAVSLLGKRAVANIDRILHRGEYAIIEEKKDAESHAEHHRVGRFWRLIGVNSREFSKVDRGLFLYTFLYGLWGISFFIVLYVLDKAGYMTKDKWLSWWHIYLIVMTVIAFAGGIWISIGGIFDFRKMYQRLARRQRDELDDGRVAGDHNLADETIVPDQNSQVRIEPAVGHGEDFDADIGGPTGS